MAILGYVAWFFFGFSLAKLLSGRKVGKGIAWVKVLPSETKEQTLYALGYLKCLEHMNGGFPAVPKHELEGA